MSMVANPLRLLAVEILSESDVVVARQRARQICEAVGFETLLQTQVATVVSEIARNAYEYARGGRAEFFVETKPHPAGNGRLRQTLLIVVSDHGPGIAQLDEILAGRYRSKTGLGVGIVGSQKLMDRVDIQSSEKGTTVTIARIFPPTVATRSPAQLAEILRPLSASPVDPARESQIQNQELIRSLDEARERKEELERVNQELSETNTGVLVLYDELDTLHRISMMLASKLELRPLIQSIVDVTTTLTDADLGAFFFYEELPERWQLYSTSGTRADALEGFPEHCPKDFFGPDFSAQGMVHVPDLQAEERLESIWQFAAALAGKFTIQSSLTVPVLDSSQMLIGAMVFAGGRRGLFTERSERILTSIATQAAIGIEKARLFQSVTSANEAKDQFFATLSHELRTPLNPALATISSLHGDPRVPEELKEDIAIIWRNIRLEARLIDDLLDFNRLIKGKLQLATGALDMHTLIDGVVAICREDLEAKGHQFTARLGAPRAIVVGDGARLQQVLWNVLKNAIKFTPPRGAISLETSVSGDVLRIAVTDNGRGIEPDDVQRIFSAFDQGDKRLAGHFGGLGLGLSIAQMFIELHGGTISATSRGLGFGATVTIEIPLAHEAEIAPVAPVPLTSSVFENLHGRILLVDDHPDTLSALTRLLRRRGYEVTAASSGAEAIRVVRQKSFDLLVSDLGLPDCSGLALLQQIRQLQQFPAIALSGYGMEADLEGSRKAGFQRHITKPVDFEQLQDAITAILAVAPGSQDAVPVQTE